MGGTAERRRFAAEFDDLYGFAITFDARRGVTIAHGGQNWYSPNTWEWDGRSWSQRPLAGPSERYGHATVYDPSRRGVLLFGGDSQGIDLGHVWELAFHELAPDIDDDCDVDMLDLAAFQTCFGADRRLAHCERFDVDLTGDLTMADFEAFQRKLSGPSPPE